MFCAYLDIRHWNEEHVFVFLGQKRFQKCSFSTLKR